MTWLLMVTFQTAGKIQNWGISTKLGRLGIWFEVVTVHCRASFGFVFSTTHPTHMLIGAWDFHLDFGPPAATSWGYADLPPLGFTWHVAVVGKNHGGRQCKAHDDLKGSTAGVSVGHEGEILIASSKPPIPQGTRENSPQEASDKNRPNHELLTKLKLLPELWCNIKWS